MKRLQQITSDIKIVYKDVEREFEFANIKTCLNFIEAFFNIDEFIIDIVLLTNICSADVECLSTFLFSNPLIEFENAIKDKKCVKITQMQNDRAFLYRIYFADQTPPKRMENKPSFVSFCVYDPNLIEEDFSLLAFHRFLENAPLIISLSTNENIRSFFLQSLAQSRLIQTTIKEISAKQNINSILNTISKDEILLLNRNSIIEYISYTNQIFKYSIEQEADEVNAKKFIFQQQITRLQPGNNISSNNDWLQNLKSSINRYLSDYEKGVRTKMEDSVRPLTGQIWQEMEGRVNELNALDKIDKAKTTEVRIFQEFETDFLDTMYRILYQSFANDLKSLSDLYKEIANKIEEELKQAGVNILPYNFNYLSDISINKILGSAIRIDRPYKNETPRKGAMNILWQ
jgi:hypothetical protein